MNRHTTFNAGTDQPPTTRSIVCLYAVACLFVSCVRPNDAPTGVPQQYKTSNRASEPQLANRNRGGAWAMPRAEFELVPRPSPVGPAVASRRAHRRTARPPSGPRAGTTNTWPRFPRSHCAKRVGSYFLGRPISDSFELRVSGVCVALCAACPVRGGAYPPGGGAYAVHGTAPRRCVASCEAVRLSQLCNLGLSA